MQNSLMSGIFEKALRLRGAGNIGTEPCHNLISDDAKKVRKARNMMDSVIARVFLNLLRK